AFQAGDEGGGEDEEGPGSAPSAHPYHDGEQYRSRVETAILPRVGPPSTAAHAEDSPPPMAMTSAYPSPLTSPAAAPADDPGDGRRAAVIRPPLLVFPPFLEAGRRE